VRKPDDALVPRLICIEPNPHALECLKMNGVLVSATPRALSIMFNPWFEFGLKAVQMGVEAQSVIALRMLRMAAGGARAKAEASRMVTEKVAATAAAQIVATVAAISGKPQHVVANRALKVFKKRVRANRRRLSRH
jgi:hypothetical protein